IKEKKVFKVFTNPVKSVHKVFTKCSQKAPKCSHQNINKPLHYTYPLCYRGITVNGVDISGFQGLMIHQLYVLNVKVRIGIRRELNEETVQVLFYA
ncbi:unnamed protein product, partial [marine sediment metagenome]